MVQSYASCIFLTCPMQASPWERSEWPLALLRGAVPKLFKQHCSLDLGIIFAKLFISGVQISRLISGIHITAVEKFLVFYNLIFLRLFVMLQR